MNYTQLIKLEEMIDIESEILEKLDVYFSSLNQNTKKVITASKMSLITGIHIRRCAEILTAYSLIGILKTKYSIHCPKCGLSIMQVSTFNEIKIEPFTCYGCDEEIEISLDDVTISYTLNC